MPALVALAFVVILAFVALAVLGFAAHLLLSPWLWVAAIAIVAWVKFRPRHSRR